MLIMPKPAAVPEAVWELAENKEMEQVVHLYGKIYHLWQVSFFVQAAFLPSIPDLGVGRQGRQIAAGTPAAHDKLHGGGSDAGFRKDDQG
jgi:hypothetical protein